MKTYDELSKRCETITKSISHNQTRYIFVEFSAEMFSEIDRLNRKIKDQENRLKITNDRNVMLANIERRTKMEICTKVNKLKEGAPYIPGPDEFVITEKHTIADVVRWMISEGWADEALYMLKEIEKSTGFDNKTPNV